jgi:transcriptional regulator with XRE-family HTH domain
MSDQVIPEWDMADRLRKALRHAGLEQQEMAGYLGVSRNSVSNWVNGNNRPSGPALKLWALRTGVPFEWLRDGSAAAEGVNRLGWQTLAVAA